MQLQGILALRDNSRRHANPLLKPLSEVDLTQFQPQITPSYYQLPADYPMPVCSGRYTCRVSADCLNDAFVSITTGSENFKCKQKNVHEDLLFKNEDDMYSVDHVVLQLQTVVGNLQREVAWAHEWDALPEDQRPPFKVKNLSRVTLAFIDKFYTEETKLVKKSRVTDKIPTKPVIVLETFLKRLQS